MTLTLAPEVTITRSDVLGAFGIPDDSTSSSGSSSSSSDSSSSSSSMPCVDCGKLFTQKHVLKKDLGHAHKGWKLAGSDCDDTILSLNKLVQEMNAHIKCRFSRRIPSLYYGSYHGSHHGGVGSYHVRIMEEVKFVSYDTN